MAVRRVGPNDWRLWRDLRLAALGEAPAAFGSTLAEWQGDGDTEARWRDRLSSVGFNVVAEHGGIPAGMVSGLDDGSEVELISMWVAPSARGSGTGDVLVRSVLDWAAAVGRDDVFLLVRASNAHATALYRRHGFVDDGPNPDQEPGDPPERRMVRRRVRGVTARPG